MANLLKLLSNMIDAYEKFISFNNRVRKVVIDRVKNKHWRMYEIAKDGVDFSQAIKSVGNIFSSVINIYMFIIMTFFKYPIIKFNMIM